MKLATFDEVKTQVIKACESFQARYPEHIPRIAFDCDQTLIQGDIGEFTLLYALLHKIVHPHKQWWTLLSDVTDIVPLQKAYQAAVQEDGMLDADLLSAIWRAYQALCVYDVEKAYIWAAQCFHHYSLEEARTISQSIYQYAKVQSLELTSGIELRASQKKLIYFLQQQGVEVWIISSSQQLMIECVAKDLNIPAQQAVGVSYQLDEMNLITLQTQAIEPIGHDKKHYFETHISDIPPVAMFGDSKHDLPLMAHSYQGFFIEHASLSQEVKNEAESLGVHFIYSQDFI